MSGGSLYLVDFLTGILSFDYSFSFPSGFWSPGPIVGTDSFFLSSPVVFVGGCAPSGCGRFPIARSLKVFVVFLIMALTAIPANMQATGASNSISLFITEEKYAANTPHIIPSKTRKLYVLNRNAFIKKAQKYS